MNSVADDPWPRVMKAKPLGPRRESQMAYANLGLTEGNEE